MTYTTTAKLYVVIVRCDCHSFLTITNCCPVVLSPHGRCRGPFMKIRWQKRVKFEEHPAQLYTGVQFSCTPVGSRVQAWSSPRA